MLDESIRETVTMPARVEAEKTHVESNEDRVELIIANRVGSIREDHDFLEIDSKGGNPRNSEESIPILLTDTSVLNSISLMPTDKDASLIFCTKSGPGAPVIRNSTNMCEGKGKRFVGGKQIPRNHVANLSITGGFIENSASLHGNKPFKTEGRSLFRYFFVNLMLCENSKSMNVVMRDKVGVSMAYGLDAGGVTQFIVKIFQDYVEPIINIVNLIALSKHILRSDMGDPDFGSN